MVHYFLCLACHQQYFDFWKISHVFLRGYQCWTIHGPHSSHIIHNSHISHIFFFYQGFLHRHWRFTRQQGKGGDHLLFHSITSNCSQTLRHLFATLQVRWQSRIFNRNVCVYQTATRWDLPTYRIIIWVIGWWYNVCFFTWWIDTRFLLQQFDIGNRWIWTRIDYPPCITSELTNQVFKVCLTILGWYALKS